MMGYRLPISPIHTERRRTAPDLQHLHELETIRTYTFPWNCAASLGIHANWGGKLKFED